MKKRIEQLLNGRFEYEKGPLMLIPEALDIHVTQGGRAKGSFWIESPDEKKVRGFLYSTNPRLLFEPAEFNGTRTEIHYQADGSGFPEEMIEEDCITICSSLGEYRLPVRLISERVIRDKKEERQVPDPSQLARMAKEDYQKSYRIFIDPAFRALLAEKDPEHYGLYASLMEGSSGFHTLEEFLVGSGQKEEVRIQTDRTEITIPEITEPVRETIVLTKSGWGFRKISVESDAPFVRPERTLFSTDEFAGSSLELNIILDPGRMHAGNNYARVTISTTVQTFTLEVTAHAGQGADPDYSARTRRQMQKRLENLYIAFRLDKLEKAEWIRQSKTAIESYRSVGGNDPFADLFLVQLYYAEGKTPKAIRLLENVNSENRLFDKPEQYCFYRYLTTFFYQDFSYVDQVESEIRAMFSRHPDNWKLQWILLYLQERLIHDDHAKYEAIAEQFRLGCRSRIMYQEAYRILKEDPFRMHHLGTFELQILRFAAREKVLTVEMIRQTANLASHYGKYSRVLLEILESGFRTSPSEDILKAVCMILMKGERKDPDAFEWYAHGVESGLRISGLYEYYMESAQECDLTKMPQIIRMYFVYDTTLDYRRRAAIYRSILEQKETDVQTYRTYRAAMEKFAMEQLEMGRLTPDLAVLYRKFIRKKNLTRQMAEQLTRLLFTWEISCDLPAVRSVTIHSECMIQEQTAVFDNGKARVILYDPKSIAVIENQQGERFHGGTLIRKDRLLESEEMLGWCRSIVPEFTGIVLDVCAACAEKNSMEEADLPYVRNGCVKAEFSAAFRDRLRMMLLQYYAEHPRDDTLSDFLDRISLEEYAKIDKTTVIALLAEEGRCSEAFEILDRYGSEQIPVLQLVRISSRMVLEMEFAENAMLVSMCWTCFRKEKYNDILLRYLLLYFEGSIEEMEAVWDAAGRYDLDTMLLEEKVLMMILYTGSRTEGSDPLFESYVRKMGRRKLCKAYLNLRSYEYFVKGLPAAEFVFRCIERDYSALAPEERTMEQEEVCRLALLQYYSGLPGLKEEQKENVKSLLAEFNVKGMRFAFWKKFDRELLGPYQLDGRIFVEYAGNPKSSVSIYWRKKGSGSEYRKEPVNNCFEGIFVKEFTLFYGDELECWLEEERDGSQKRTDERILSWPKKEMTGLTQYELLGRMSKAMQENDDRTLKAEMENYLLQEYLAEEIFTLI